MCETLPPKDLFSNNFLVPNDCRNTVETQQPTWTCDLPNSASPIDASNGFVHCAPRRRTSRAQRRHQLALRESWSHGCRHLRTFCNASCGSCNCYFISCDFHHFTPASKTFHFTGVPCLTLHPHRNKVDARRPKEHKDAQQSKTKAQKEIKNSTTQRENANTNQIHSNETTHTEHMCFIIQGRKVNLMCPANKLSKVCVCFKFRLQRFLHVFGLSDLGSFLSAHVSVSCFFLSALSLSLSLSPSLCSRSSLSPLFSLLLSCLSSIIAFSRLARLPCLSSLSSCLTLFSSLSSLSSVARKQTHTQSRERTHTHKTALTHRQ